MRNLLELVFIKDVNHRRLHVRRLYIDRSEFCKLT